jgi:hypothetical protein
VLEGENHLSAPLRLDLLAAPLAGWFAQLPQTPCPGFDLAAAPATSQPMQRGSGAGTPSRAWHLRPAR